MEIKMHKILDHYEIYVDGVFKQSCDLNELEEIENEDGNTN